MSRHIAHRVRCTDGAARLVLDHRQRTHAFGAAQPIPPSPAPAPRLPSPKSAEPDDDEPTEHERRLCAEAGITLDMLRDEPRRPFDESESSVEPSNLTERQHEICLEHGISPAQFRATQRLVKG